MKKILLAAGITVLCLVVVGVIICFFNRSAYFSPSVKSNTPQTKDNDISSNEFAGWESYDNKRYGYQMRFPANWYADITYAENDFTQASNVGGQITFSNYPDISKYDYSNPSPSDLFILFMRVEKIDPKNNYDQLSRDFGFNMKEFIVINEQEGVRLAGISSDHPVGVMVVNTLFKQGDKMFVFNYSGNSISQSAKDIADKIIKSFTIQ